MIDELMIYANAINASDEVLNWLTTTGKKALETQKIKSSDLEHIIDFLVSSKAPSRLQKMSLMDAKRLSKKWSEQNQKKGKNLVDAEDDIETIHNFSDGSRIVKLLTKKSLVREGFFMSHCLGGYEISEKRQIYSYRDKANLPHATFEVQREAGEIVQIKGKGNGEIHPKYIHSILEFLRSINMEVRDKEMEYLGYYLVPEVHIEFLKTKAGLFDRTTMLNGKRYAY